MYHSKSNTIYLELYYINHTYYLNTNLSVAIFYFDNFFIYYYYHYNYIFFMIALVKKSINYVNKTLFFICI